MESAPIRGASFRTAFVLILVLLISLLMIAVVWPFLKTLLLSAIFAGLFHPVFKWISRVIGGHRSLASIATVLFLFFLIVGPISFLGTLMVKQGVQVTQNVAPWVREQIAAGQRFDVHQWVTSRWPPAAEIIPSREELANHAGNVAKTAGTLLADWVSALTAGTAGFILHFLLLLYAMFFFLKDGRAILEQVFYYIPLNHEDEALLLERFVAVTKATIKGTLFIGAIQGSLAGIGFYFAGITGVVFWAMVMTLLSIIPGIGSALVWIPAVIYLFVSGQTVAGTALAIWCAVVVGTVDNILRPLLVGKDAGMPDLLIMFGTLGGLLLFGPFGFIIGPIVCGLFLTVWELYGVAFRDILPPVKLLPPAAKS